MPANPLRSARTCLPAQTVLAAGVFAVQDQVLAVGLLGSAAVAARAGALSTNTLELAPYRNWLPTPFLVAVSAAAIHILDWDHDGGATEKLARFARAATTVSVEPYANARRLTLVDRASGYRLPLTATVSRLNAYGRPARSVLQAVGVQ